MACLHPLLLLRLSLITIRQSQFSHFLLWKIVASHDQEGNAIVSNEGKDLDVEKDQEQKSGTELVPATTRLLPKIIPFRDLCRCGDEVWIEHQGQLYRLRCTKQGKLLLTK